jgi:hypothetical protein
MAVGPICARICFKTRLRLKTAFGGSLLPKRPVNETRPRRAVPKTSTSPYLATFNRLPRAFPETEKELGAVKRLNDGGSAPALQPRTVHIGPIGATRHYPPDGAFHHLCILILHQISGY